ncbi:hypothetical protein IscW_ISCW017831 [Ixodes scapularis]|uniref:Uncharacterized protein n=1 Tax=Ixodes scapularis TaxID=6945 RepID=B7PEV7_IXOSC|nr:hypothetical protein IscW_ISCW017831 [Ixodes scapularis]|eukprot:XP_002433729.1 hypothetical protein IscW_ISCW017831 [Ixodes scapularis]
MADVCNCAPRVPAAISETRTHTHSWHTNPAAKTAGICVNNSGQQPEPRQAVGSRDGACQTNKAFAAPSGLAKRNTATALLQSESQSSRPDQLVLVAANAEGGPAGTSSPHPVVHKVAMNKRDEHPR